jgi:hypothetical protein
VTVSCDTAEESNAEKVWRRYLLQRRLLVAGNLIGLAAGLALLFAFDPVRAWVYVVILVVALLFAAAAWYRVRKSLTSGEEDREPPVWITRGSHRNDLTASAFSGTFGWLASEPFGDLYVDDEGINWYPTDATVKSRPGIGQVTIPIDRIADVSVHESRSRRGLVVRTVTGKPILFVTSRRYGLDFDSELIEAGWKS